ncbi:hypothetical protein GP2143_16841 [marine gamma proteobacterium HTCC2143]|uniref:Uncharacterized protein n=1 Tax=marine gamma proteobacterium HTCC2143 TaxID=247633 RepID=A0Y9Y8_9GAMM|nr:hypothetical protein GP2143_16841 [marine gamma proteobacterium HTCC2143]
MALDQGFCGLKAFYIASVGPGLEDFPVIMRSR